MIALMVLGCVVPERPELPTDDTGQPTQPTPEPATPPSVPCNPSVDDEIGTPGGHAVDSYTFEWTEGFLSGAESPALQLRLPEDLISLQLIGLGVGDQPVGMGAVSLDGVDVTDAVNRQPFFNAQINTVLPAGAATELALDVPSGGHCLEFQLLGATALAGTTGTLHLVSRRGGDARVIDLNFIFAGSSANRLSQNELAEMVQQIRTTWERQGGPTVGEVQTFTLDVSSVVSESDAIQAAGASVEPDVVTGVDVFIFDDVLGTEGGLLGFAGGVPGVNGLDGLFGSGVIILLDGHVAFNGDLSGDLLGATIAHEVGHQIGLNHTTERDGSSTALYTDVPVCDPSNDTNGDGLVDTFECVGSGADNFMFWTTTGSLQSSVSPEQAMVLRSAVAGR